MSKEKQIEEMMKHCSFYEKGKCILLEEKEVECDMNCDLCDFAKSLYAAGYRKQSENVIELPFKVGDTVYVPWRWAFQQGVATVKVEEIKFYDTQMHYMFLIDMESDNECFNQSFGGWKIGKSVGNTVFLTKEEAEAKMKGGAG